VTRKEKGKKGLLAAAGCEAVGLSGGLHPLEKSASPGERNHPRYGETEFKELKKHLLVEGY